MEVVEGGGGRGSRSHSDFFCSEIRPKIALNQY